MKRSIFDLGNEGRALETALEDAEGEIDPVLERWFDSLGEEREEKLESYAFVIAEYEARAEIQRNKAKAILERAKANENQVARLKARLKVAFETYGWQRQKAGALTISLTKNGGVLPLKWRFDDEETLLAWVPPRFVIQVPKVDKDAVRAALEAEANDDDLAANSDIDFAELGERGTHISIR